MNTRYTPTSSSRWPTGPRVWQTTDQNGTPYVEIQDTDGTFHDPVPSDLGPQRQPAPQHRRVADPDRPGHDLGGMGQRAATARRPGPRRRTAPRARSPGVGRRRPWSGRPELPGVELRRDRQRSAVPTSSRGRCPTRAPSRCATAATCTVADVSEAGAHDRLHAGSPTSARARRWSAAVSSRGSRPAGTRCTDVLTGRAADARPAGVPRRGRTQPARDVRPPGRAAVRPAGHREGRSRPSRARCGRTTPTC